LEITLEGFKQKVISKFNKNIQFIEYSGKNVDHLNNCARLLSSNENINAFFTLGSPACHALIHQEQYRPIIFAAVSDPAIHTINKKNLCGISDKTNKDHHAKLVKKLIPSAQKIGIIYTADEAHTQEQLDELVSSMKKAKLTPYTINLREKNPQSKYRKLDALFILEDNIIASSMKDLTQQALKNKKPLFAGYTLAVTEGALAAQGVNYHKSGRLAGKYALKLLKKQLSPTEIGVTQAPDEDILINKNVCKKLQISVPSDLVQYELAPGEQI
jgi:putative ABC transport system substrate-binding protein